MDMYGAISDALGEADASDDVQVTVLTGAGDWFCSGNDLSNFDAVPGDLHAFADEAHDILRRFVGSFIDSRKPIVAGINGPAVGIGVTMTALCDVSYASHHATFHTPFVSLGQSPEAVSSAIFPALMGESKACEMLLMGRKLSAVEAEQRNLLAAVFEKGDFNAQLAAQVARLAAAPRNALLRSRELVRAPKRAAWHAANDAECELLRELWTSEECMTAVMSFLTRK
eukprot:PLAT5808.1.p1 GENE.PLAT5808.1~~PLAT5808.1.p1  ORF type:complete len:227 (+),score=113.29 PLAT5808.1:431-1111(+)